VPSAGPLAGGTWAIPAGSATCGPATIALAGPDTAAKTSPVEAPLAPAAPPSPGPPWAPTRGLRRLAAVPGRLARARPRCRDYPDQASGDTLYLEAAAGVTAAVLAGRYLEARARGSVRNVTYVSGCGRGSQFRVTKT
jgi:hypothetical protein